MFFFCRKLKHQARERAKEREAKEKEAREKEKEREAKTQAILNRSHNKENETAIKLSVSGKDGKMAIPSLKSSKSVADQVKQELEEQLKQQRLTMQQVSCLDDSDFLVRGKGVFDKSLSLILRMVV